MYNPTIFLLVLSKKTDCFTVKACGFGRQCLLFVLEIVIISKIWRLKWKKTDI